MLIVAFAPIARSRPIDKLRDRTDNKFSFTYRARNGRITEAFSTTILRRDDRVVFHNYVADRPGAPSGKRLSTKLTLDLRGNRAVEYDGVFTVVVKDSDGNTIRRLSGTCGWCCAPGTGTGMRLCGGDSTSRAAAISPSGAFAPTLVSSPLGVHAVFRWVPGTAAPVPVGCCKKHIL